MAKLVVLLVLAVTALACEAYQMTKCQLVKELRRHGFPEHEMRDWVCLVEAESSRRTHVVGPPNSDGSRDHGLFQINDRYWCSNTGTPGLECNVTCSDLRQDDIKKAVACVRKIYKRHQFKAWYAWVNKCQGRPLPDISGC